MTEGSAACALGLFTGLMLLLFHQRVSWQAVTQLLEFNAAGFFTCAAPARAPARRAVLRCFASSWRASAAAAHTLPPSHKHAPPQESAAPQKPACKTIAWTCCMFCGDCTLLLFSAAASPATEKGDLFSASHSLFSASPSLFSASPSLFSASPSLLHPHTAICCRLSSSTVVCLWRGIVSLRSHPPSCYLALAVHCLHLCCWAV
jgi:hypothetical protein